MDNDVKNDFMKAIKRHRAIRAGELLSSSGTLNSSDIIDGLYEYLKEQGFCIVKGKVLSDVMAAPIGKDFAKKELFREFDEAELSEPFRCTLIIGKLQ